jgi:hypothetical protein
MTIFARLEDTTHGQCLAEIIAPVGGEKCGPSVRLRIDKGFTVEVTVGPYSDDAAGWDNAEKHLADLVMQDVADELAGMAAKLSA